ncbi:hypothetical protein Poli38472_004365 [Pythium oligandrum]|uniref:WW domain-containing protein n=1 Tax=Pythium oligandrum TaxID=41045 RepID=A0A8K1FED1_PYTOL|nr:hypothetical protein Poli38472_004365 [Pythium oligandrum]|eukprot:TMW59296.1 hypothetical protein Poli38472_004365 [Pythium oligandrum]
MSASTHQAHDSVVLEEQIDPNYEPSDDEVLEYALWLGLDVNVDRDLFWIAREGLKAPLPANWKPCRTLDSNEIYYFNFATGKSTWDHPCDEHYKKLYQDHKTKRVQETGQETADLDPPDILQPVNTPIDDLGSQHCLQAEVEALKNKLVMAETERDALTTKYKGFKDHVTTLLVEGGRMSPHCLLWVMPEDSSDWMLVHSA